MSFPRWSGRALCAALTAVSLAACDGFVSSDTTNPNQIADPTLDQLFIPVQVNTFFFNEADVGRITSVLVQQMGGTARQAASWDTYVLNEDDADLDFSAVYAQGGLIGVQSAEQRATDADRITYRGILEVHEAYLIGMAASVWGDIPYSEAAKPDITAPKRDAQHDVYAAVQQLLDAAITDLASGQGAGPGPADLNFGGDPARWTAVANTLKARFYMHWVEAQAKGVAGAETACGGNCLSNAIAAAQKGIQSSAGDWANLHSASATEQNLWYQFTQQRSGDVASGAYLVNLLNGGTPGDTDDDDPRLALFFTEGTGPNEGEFVGSPAGAPNASASQLSNEAGKLGAADAALGFVTCSENQFILAEAQYRSGSEPAALAALNAGRACEASRWGVTLPPLSGLSGAALLDAIRTQKYIALVLNIEAYNDFKRSGLPGFEPANDQGVPGRLFYGSTERESNSDNIPTPNDQPPRNENDPEGFI
jgi:hypothetical protein